MRQSLQILKDNLKYLLKLVWGYDKSLFAVFVAFSISGATLSYVEIYVPKVLLGCLIQKLALHRLLIQAGLLGLVILAITFVNSWTGNRYQCKCGLVRSDWCLNLLTVKRFRIRYCYLEDPKTADSLEKAKYISWSSNVGIEATLNNLQAFARGFILLAGVSAICVTLNPVIPFVLIVTAAVNLLLGNASKKKDVQIREQNASLDREIEYLNSNMGEPDMGKDVRVYGLKDWWLKKYAVCLGMRLENEANSQKTLTGMRQIATLLTMAANSAVYICLIGDVVFGGISVDDFLLYLGAAGTLSLAFQGMIDSATNIAQYSKCISDFRQVMELPEEFEEVEEHFMEEGSVEAHFTGKSAGALEEDKGVPSIRFDRVGYCYPGSAVPVLSNLSFKIQKGQRVALIGVNGAGKTTIVKLLTGLLEPDEGTIFVDGIDTRLISRQQLYDRFSVVFQEINQYAFTVSQNISFQQEYDTERMLRALEESEMRALVDGFPKGMDTMLRKDYAADGIVLSGGQAQELALARALYKDSPFLILDEPTAALDALAEERLYRRFDRIMEGKTVLFISHRLASTRFCDQILVIDGGTVREEGTHEGLLQAGGLYARMYESQSAKYAEEKGEES